MLGRKILCPNFGLKKRNDHVNVSGERPKKRKKEKGRQMERNSSAVCRNISSFLWPKRKQLRKILGWEMTSQSSARLPFLLRGFAPYHKGNLTFFRQSKREEEKWILNKLSLFLSRNHM